jgi:hypothetical protein
MDEQLQQKIEDMEVKINEIHHTIAATKKMFMWSLVISVLLFLIPLVILIFLLPSMLSTISGAYSGLL